MKLLTNKQSLRNIMRESYYSTHHHKMNLKIVDTVLISIAFIILHSKDDLVCL